MAKVVEVVGVAGGEFVLRAEEQRAQLLVLQDVERPSGEVTVERVVLHRLGRDEAQLLFEFLQRARGADDAPVLVSEGEPT